MPNIDLHPSSNSLMHPHWQTKPKTGRTLCHYIQIMQMTSNVHLTEYNFWLLETDLQFSTCPGCAPRITEKWFQWISISRSISSHGLLAPHFCGFDCKYCISISTHDPLVSHVKNPIADLFQLHSDGSHRHRSNARGTLRGGCNCISLHRQSAANHHRAPDVVRVPEDCSDSQ